MWGASFFDALEDFLKFKGFKDEPFKRKLEWLAKYPIVALVVGILIVQAYIGSGLYYIYEKIEKMRR